MDHITIQINLNIKSAIDGKNVVADGNEMEVVVEDLLSRVLVCLQNGGGVVEIPPDRSLVAGNAVISSRNISISGVSFTRFARDEITRLEQDGRFNTARNYRTALGSFLRFRKGKDVFFHQITPDLMGSYASWLNQAEVCPNTVSCYMRSLSAVYNKGVEKKLAEHCRPFAHVFTGMEKTAKRAVTQEDLCLLQSLTLKEKSPLVLARNLFLFSVFARGMPFVDMAYLKKGQVREGYIVYRRHKTRQQLKVKVEPCMQEILGLYDSPDSDYVFPLLTPGNGTDLYRQYRNKLSYYNKQLKQLSVLLGTGCHLSSYVSRHTWASIAYRSDIELPTISQALGHSTPQTTLIYIKELETSVVDKANEKLVGKILFNNDKPASI